MTLTSRYMTFCLTVYDSVLVMKLYVKILYLTSAYILSEYGFRKCEYSNIIGNTVVSRTYCEHPLLGAANLLCEATWSFQKIVFCIQHVQMDLLCATLAVSQGWRDQDLLKADRSVCNCNRFTLSSKVSKS